MEREGKLDTRLPFLEWISYRKVEVHPVRARGRIAMISNRDTPVLKNLARRMVSGRAPVSPLEEASCGIGAQALFFRQDAYSTQVETVGVPASLDSRIRFGESVGMQAAGLVEEFKTRIIEMHKRSSQGMGKIAPAQTMTAVDTFIDPARIVEEGEKFHHLEIRSIGFGNPASILHHPCPVEHAMCTGLGK